MTASPSHVLGTLGRWLPVAQKRRAKAIWSSWRLAYVRRFRAYSPDELASACSRLGLAAGDIVLMHSRLSPFNGFKGQPAEIVQAVRQVLGEAGTLAMVSLPYRSSTLKYLEAHPRFDVRRTPSRMGLLTEIFRRQPGTLRSLSPTHPVLAQGPRAEWLLAGHDRAVYPCGDDTPFSRLAEAGGKILFFDLPLRGFTFMHYVEHVHRAGLPFPVYEQRAYQVPVVDAWGRGLEVTVHPFSVESSVRRRRGAAARELLTSDLVVRRRIGNTRLYLVRAADVVRAGGDMVARGVLFT
jgi:aminoglycoside 3-N-acetyltransferase